MTLRAELLIRRPREILVMICENIIKSAEIVTTIVEIIIVIAEMLFNPAAKIFMPAEILSINTGRKRVSALT
jgi:hypothetical protein